MHPKESCLGDLDQLHHNYDVGMTEDIYCNMGDYFGIRSHRLVGEYGSPVYLRMLHGVFCRRANHWDSFSRTNGRYNRLLHRVIEYLGSTEIHFQFTI